MKKGNTVTDKYEKYGISKDKAHTKQLPLKEDKDFKCLHIILYWLK